MCTYSDFLWIFKLYSRTILGVLRIWSVSQQGPLKAPYPNIDSSGSAQSTADEENINHCDLQILENIRPILSKRMRYLRLELRQTLIDGLTNLEHGRIFKGISNVMKRFAKCVSVVCAAVVKFSAANYKVVILHTCIEPVVFILLFLL